MVYVLYVLYVLYTPERRGWWVDSFVKDVMARVVRAVEHRPV